MRIWKLKWPCSTYVISQLTVVFELGDVTSKICEFWLPSMLKVTVVVTMKLLGSWPSTGVGGVELFGVAGLDHRGGGAGGVLCTQIYL